jgi:hypothetical protein
VRFDRMEHADQDLAPRDEAGLGAPAGVFLLDGEYHVAAFRTRAAHRLAEQGALLVGALHFSAQQASLATDGGWKGDAGPWLRPLRAPHDLPRLGGSSGRN